LGAGIPYFSTEMISSVYLKFTVLHTLATIWAIAVVFWTTRVKVCNRLQTQHTAIADKAEFRLSLPLVTEVALGLLNWAGLTQLAHLSSNCHI
jgi:undecaprenyl pyrophosphate phosphatase UppP